MKTTHKISFTSIFWMVALMLCVSVNAKAQTINPENGTTTSVAAATAETSSLNMVSWFMGTKQTPKATISSEGQESAKKQMINAGIAPNRLLIKAFLKKASNYQSTIA